MPGQQEPVVVWHALAAPGCVYTTEAFAARGHVCTTGAWASPRCLYSTEAFAEPRLVCTVGAFKCVPWEIFKILYMEIITEFRKNCIIMQYKIPRKSAKFFRQFTDVQKTEFHVDGISWTPYLWAEHIIPQISGQTLSFSCTVNSFAMHIQWCNCTVVFKTMVLLTDFYPCSLVIVFWIASVNCIFLQSISYLWNLACGWSMIRLPHSSSYFYLC